METFTRDGLTFEVTDAGPSDGEVVVLLHGFPQDRRAWDQVTPALNDAGLRTLAPDQRGYSPGARPPKVRDYRMRELVRDVLALADAAGAERFHLVGHDWGGAVAWVLAGGAPDRIASLTVASTPHPQALSWAFTHSDQGRRSSYMAMFQLPRVPERRLRSMMPAFYQRTGLSAEQAQAYTDRFDDPADLTAPMNWYRAMVQVDGRQQAGAAVQGLLRRGSSPQASEIERAVRVPTTFVWGRRDFALGEAAARRTACHVAGAPDGDYRFIVLDEGHWLPETAPAQVAEAILDRVRAS